jgi:murein DD-endopeptidase MepM/ murein hydrolase activator NlpD
MAMHRLGLLVILGACTVAVLAGPIAAPIPTSAPVSMAKSSFATPYWPVAADRPGIRVVPARLVDGSTQGNVSRSFDQRRPANPALPQTRRHVGVDLTANEGDKVVAIEDGTIIDFYSFFKRPPGTTQEVTFALIVRHAEHAVLYGELRSNSLVKAGLKRGDLVKAGQIIGEVSGTKQLHLEVYDPSVTHNIQWPLGKPAPAAMRNPTQWLIDLSATAR